MPHPAGSIVCESQERFITGESVLRREVTLLEVLPQILTKEDPDAAKIVEKALVRDGVKIICCCEIEKIEKKGEEKIIRFKMKGETCAPLTVDAILIGVGRAPNVEGLGLETVGVDYDKRKGVTVDDHLRTTNPRIFAAGDISSMYKFTHAADFCARIVIQNALFPGPKKKASALTIPWCTYTDPEIAHVGLYEKDAKTQGIPVKTFVQELADVDRAILEGDDEGLVKIHVREGSDEILGATIVARHAGDMISEVTTAMACGMGLGKLANVIHPFPTTAEAIRKMGDQFNRTRLTPTVKSLFQKWLGWTR